MSNIPQTQEISLDQIGHLKTRNQAMPKGQYKTKSLKNRPDPTAEKLKKPVWIKAKLPKAKDIHKVKALKNILREQGLHSVCEEASCPNLGECFGHGTATFMVMGDICTRKCPFCDVAHGRPKALNQDEPAHLARTVHAMQLNYVVITSVDRDDLRDGGSAHFTACISAIRQHAPKTNIEALVPDFRGRLSVALETLNQCPPDVLNHNLETVPRLYPRVRPGARYYTSLRLLDDAKRANPQLFTKSGIMVGLGETKEEVMQVMDDMRSAGIDFLTIGQYLQPTRKHAAIDRYVTPDEFKGYETIARAKGFLMVSATPLTRSSYHAGEDFEKLRAAREAALAAGRQV